jgi:hypothetical protein
MERPIFEHCFYIGTDMWHPDGKEGVVLRCICCVMFGIRTAYEQSTLVAFNPYPANVDNRVS